METDPASDPSVLKHREILFSPLHPDRNQARSARLLLSDLDGIHELDDPEPQRLTVRYDVQRITLQEIESLLSEVGFHLDNSLLAKLKRALVYYTEDTLRANLGCPHGRNNCTRDIFIKRYQSLQHGCRDPRPGYWRNYL